ncbi:class I glutamine amidotransferase-like protein [Dendryphion nanum]|uniref:Class I glutamine amidotransferase-like protein n=1 Tax=Dendryphion nanum TaxID=256645 RepID=A0A9P9EJU7_9PLEO|nr:class I glutamine amidotransferase-like protein [Dendryphion nanum]
MILFQAWELIDVFGTLQPLQGLAKQYQLNLSLISESLDPVTSRPVAPSMNPLNSSFYPAIVPTHTVKNAPPLDVLIIPGGLGTRSPLINATIDYIKATAPKVKYIITICSGSLLAARAGLLNNKTATTNKQSWDATVQGQTAVNWVPHARWTVDGNIWTTSGLSSGVDGTLAWIDCIFGKELAYNMTLYMEWNREENANNDPFAALSWVF